MTNIPKVNKIDKTKSALNKELTDIATLESCGSYNYKIGDGDRHIVVSNNTDEGKLIALAIKQILAVKTTLAKELLTDLNKQLEE